LIGVRHSKQGMNCRFLLRHSVGNRYISQAKSAWDIEWEVKKLIVKPLEKYSRRRRVFKSIFVKRSRVFHSRIGSLCEHTT
jgi:hypothetical protein